jgi:hypothetical protein
MYEQILQSYLKEMGLRHTVEILCEDDNLHVKISNALSKS